MSCDKPYSFRKFLVSAAVSIVLYSATPAWGQPESRPLSEFSNEEIVAEYHLRLEEFGQNIALPLINKVSSVYEKSGVTGLTSNDALSVERVDAVMTKAYEFLLPFAEAGELSAMPFVGRHMMNNLDPDARCEGYSMLRSAAVDGELGAILLLSAYYTHHPSPSDQSEEELMFLWSREGMHRSPDLFALNFKIVSEQISELQLKEYEQKWVEWSPEEAPQKLNGTCP